MKKIIISLFLILFGFTSLKAEYLLKLQLKSNKIAYDWKRSCIYATVKGCDDHYGNNLVAIDPKTGKIIRNIFVGSEPTQLTFSTDSNYIYICFDGISSV